MNNTLKTLYDNIVCMYKNNSLSINSITKVIVLSDLEKHMKEKIIFKINIHKSCQCDNSNDSVILAIVMYEDNDIALECERCGEIILDYDLLNELI